MNRHFYHTVTTSLAVESYISRETDIDFSELFAQYLHTTQIPVFEYKISEGLLQYRYSNCIAGFTMPVKVHIKKDLWLTPTTQWQERKDAAIESTDTLVADANFYLQAKEVK